MTRNFLNALMIVGIFGTSLAAKAQNVQMDDGVLRMDNDPSAIQSYQDSLLNQTGYHVDPTDLSASFLVEDNVQRAFTGAAHLRGNLPGGQLPTSFQPIIADITDYINKIGKAGGKNNETSNGISNSVLATRIVRLSFCFGTDPYGVAAQIKAESTFNRRRTSPTGAVGLTQMTSIAIDEVNDQLGNRGQVGANATNLPYLRQAISCYTGGRGFATMMSAGVIPPGKTVDRNPGLSSRAKSWLVADIDRQLIYGQIVLKVYLANARNDGKIGKSAYLLGLQNYNGDKRHGEDKKYARAIVTQMQRI